MSVWAERVAAALDEGTLYVTSAEYEELRHSLPTAAAASGVNLSGLPVVRDDEEAAKRRRAAEDIKRSDVARLGRFRIS